jgi:hypothetical protein
MSEETLLDGQEAGYAGELVTVATFPEPAEASVARAALESTGIGVFLQGETANSMIPVAFETRLQVRPEDEAAARNLLEAMHDAPESMASVTAAEIQAEGLGSQAKP